MFFALLMGMGSTAEAADKFCSEAPYNGVIDGNVLANAPTQITIDTTCTFINWPMTKPLDTNINFQTNDPTIYLIVFDTVWYTGNLACSNIDHKIWAVDSGGPGFEGSCQDIMIPAEMIDKQSPATTAAIGVPFTYTLTMPSMNYPAGDPSENTLDQVILTDDLTATGTQRIGLDGVPLADGAELTYLNHTAYIKGGATLTEGVDYTFSDGGDKKHLTFNFGTIPALTQIVVELTVVLDDVTPTNDEGNTFINTANWTFARSIDLDENGIIERAKDTNGDGICDIGTDDDGDGVCEYEFFDPLPGEPGIAQVMTIDGPDFLVDKWTLATAVNLTDQPTFTIDAQNSGGTDAWETVITDNLPSGMCEFDPSSTVSARILAADHTLVSSLTLNDDYTVTYNACQLKVTMTKLGGKIEPDQRLYITYESRLDSTAPPLDGTELHNVAGATQWLSSDGTQPPRTYTRTLSAWDVIDTTIDDYEDSASVTAALSGYYFEKTVTNLETGANPATTAAPGDTLRYKLRVFNVDQEINNINIEDYLNPAYFEPGYANFSYSAGSGYVVVPSYDDVTDTLTFSGSPVLDVTPCYDTSTTPPTPIPGAVCELTIEFDVTLKTSLANGTIVDNQAILNADGNFTVKSDEPNSVEPPYTNLVADPDVDGDENSTNVTIQTPGPLAKTNNGQGTATIGEQFTYTITIPETPSAVPLYDVKIFDDLSGLGPDLEFVSAEVLSGGTWTLTNSNVGVDPTNKDLIIEDSGASGIDILPSNGGQVTIAITVEVLNQLVNQDTLAEFTNSAYYTYNRVNGVETTVVTGGAGTDEGKTIAEPVLDSASKSWSYVGGKAITEPAEVGDIIEYTISVTNSGSSPAYDTNIVDMLPSTVELDIASATATIGGTAVSGFVPNPADLGGGTVAWGQINSDGSLDIDPGETLELTYQVTVLSVGVPIDNSAYVDWTSLDGEFPGRERTGAGCPTVDTLNDYCVVLPTVSIPTTDTNTIEKLILDDSYTGGAVLPPELRVGDTVDYQLTLKLHEGITENVVVEDTLPPGMELTGPPTITESAGSTFTPYTVTTTPSDPLGAGDSGTLQWNFGSIENLSGTSNADSTDLLDEIVITYTAVVVTQDTTTTTAVAHVPEITDPDSTNHATLSYTGGDPTNSDPQVSGRLNSTATIDIHQPVMTPLAKDAALAPTDTPIAVGDGLTDTSAYEVDVANDTLRFTLESCNATGLAPAYNLAIRDTLPAQMGLASMVGPVVKVGADLASAVAVTEGAANDYVYTLSGTVMDFVFTDNRPIAPNECVFVQYDIGFDPNIAPNTTWNNTAEVVNYWSLPITSGREYTPTDTDSVYMTNAATLLDPIKAITQPNYPTDTTVTIGEAVQYTITIPATNATLTNVLVEDTLDAALTYNVNDATVSGGLSFTDNSSGQLFSLTIDSIPAGQDVVITLPIQVADNGTAIAGYSFDNQASYTYGGTTYTSPLAGALTIVEPQLVPTKSVTPPASDPVAGDTLSYTITIPPQTATNTSQAFDLTVVDTLGDGLLYVGGTAQFNGMSPGTTEPTLGTVGTQQTLTWAGLDIPYNTEVTITYDVQVQDTVVPYQSLTNSAYIEWTSLDTVVTGERTYSTTVNSTPLTVADTASLTKAVVADSYVDANPAAPSTADDSTVRIGDTVDYQLTLNLQEGTTQNVQVTDNLHTTHAALAFESVSVSPGTGITYSTDPISVNWDSTNGTVTFALGDVVHTPDADTDDAIVITYRVRVLKDTLAHQATTTPISNSATLSYTGSLAGNPALQSSADITVLQPVIDSLTKTDRYGLTSTAQITDVANTTMGFRLEACNSGAAPAYSMTVTDALDDTYFDVTSIANVAVSIDGAATSNYVYDNSSLPTMSFEVNDPVYPGQCVDIDFDIGFRTDFGASQTWINSFDVTEYWSLQQPDTNAQLYGPLTVPVPFEMTNNANITPPFKELLSPAEATIGEEVVYRITVPSTPNDASTMYDVAISDPLDPVNGNLEYASATITCPTCVGVSNNSTVGLSTMDITIDEIPPGEQAIIELHARVRNVLSAQQGVAIDNTVSYTYANADGDPAEPALSSSQLVTVNIVEPDITTINKTVNNTTATAGETVRYSVALTAASGADASDVFDVILTDTLDEGLAYAGNPTVTVGTSGVSVDNTIGAPATSGDGSTGNPQKLIWDLSNSDIDINAGETVTVSYDVLVLDNVLANQTLSNSVVAQWTGRDGAHTTATDYERDGSDGATGLNNYITAAVWADITIPDTNSITKVWTSDTYADGAANVRIGDTVDYTLTLSLQEGTLNNLEIVDTLPQGLEFAGIVSINGNTGPTYTAVAPFSHADITAAANVSAPGDARAGETTVTWSLSTVTNAQNDGVNDDFVIVYRARVLNNVFAHTDLTIPLNNQVAMSYDTATGRVTKSDTDTVITALQPELTVTKTALGANGDTIVEAGEVVTYTVNLENTGTAPAYDVVLQDIIPAGLRVGNVTMVNTYLLSSPLPAPGLAIAPTADPGYLSNGIVVWNFDDGNTPSSYTIPAGDTLQVIYSVVVDSNIGAGLTLTNSAQATNYYSLNNDDASPVDSAIYREEYASTAATFDVTTAAAGALGKATTQPSAAIGEEFTYIITVPQVTVPTALNDVQVYDNLAASTADLTFVGATLLPGGDWTGTLESSVDASGLVTISDLDTGGIDIPANGQIEIEVTVKLQNTANNLSAGLSFFNRAWYTYSNGVTTLGNFTDTGADSGTMTVAHPSLTMTKSGPLPAEMQVGGAPETFTLDVENTSTSDAWNVTVTDWLDNPAVGGMCDAGVTNVNVTITDTGGTVIQTLASGTDYDTSFTVSATDPRCEFVVTTTGVVVEPTQHLIVTYDAALDTDNIDGAVLKNIAGATQWLSADPASGVFNTYNAVLTDGTELTVDDHEDIYRVTAIGAVLISEKTVQNLTTGQSGANASPGDNLRYTITITNTEPNQLTNFSLVDELDRLNASPMFEAGTLTFVPAASTLSGSAVVNVDPNGGSKGTGLVEITGLDIGPSGTLTAVFDATLAPVITSGTIVLNQGQLTSGGSVFGSTDDPALAGTQDPTETLIASAPAFEVWKTSADITGDPADLVAGDSLRYTITVKNIGSENAVNTVLKDQIPANTTYVANSTTLNGNAVADPSAGVSPLQAGLAINAPEDTTSGAMRADAGTTTSNVATITFDVVINNNVINGAVISNQAFVDADGAGTSGAALQEPSDDPATTTLDDPTRDIVGNLPLVDAVKTVQILTDGGSPGLVDPDDVLRYTITVSNLGDIPATGVTLVDAIPANTTYEPNSVTLNGISLGTDGGVSPLTAGIAISSSDLTPPLPTTGNGTLSPGGTATIVFDVKVNTGVAPGTVISNQGIVSNNELPDEPTDSDGLDSNGDQSTDIVVGNVQQLSITKTVVIADGSLAAFPGTAMAYEIRVQNIGTVPAYDVVITDNLDLPVAGQVHYVSGTATLDRLTNGVNIAGSVITADYSSVNGPLAPGETTVLRFEATIDQSLTRGTQVFNTADVSWNAASQSASASADFTVDGVPGEAQLSGTAWRDINDNQVIDGTEQVLAGWSVEIYRNNTLLDTVQTDANGVYEVLGLAPNDTTTDRYSLRFIAPGAGASTALLGVADSAYTNELQRITEIVVGSGTLNENLNLPISPNGVVYDSIARTPIAGATLTMLDAANEQPLPSSCFDDAAQQNQVTPTDGFYRFDLNFSDPACPAGGDYLISVTPPSTAYEQVASLVIPPLTDATTPAFSVPGCLGSTDDAVLATTDICEVVALDTAPPTSVQARTAGTNYYLHLTLNNNQIPGENQLFNNHIPVDPILENVVSISKIAGRVSASRGEFVPYTITVNNGYYTALQDLTIVDTFPPGFKYVEGSSRYDGQPLEPVLVGGQLRWENIDLATDTEHTIKLLFIVGSGVSEGDYVNRAQVINAFTGSDISGEATATVRVVPDPNLDCTDVIGKVFDDKNLNGYQDEGESGLPGVRLVSARGLLITTDEHGRFHVTCAVVPNESRGSNYILKLDDRSLPSGYRVTSENPRVKRATRGKVIKFNFGTTIHHVVRLDVGDGVFEPDSRTMRQQWAPRIPMLIEELKKAPSVLRLSYLADVEDEGLVRERVNALKDMITEQWDALNCCYKLTIESEVYWRRGAPPERSGVID